MCLVLAMLLYFSVPAVPVVELLRDALDPEDRFAEDIITYLRKTSANGSVEEPVDPAVSERVLIGEQLAGVGLRKRHPVVFIPGIISTGLELWQGERCAKRNFRQRLWGDMAQANKMLLDIPCWLRHMRLDNETGLDPIGIKLRAASGLKAADVMLSLYSLWGTLVQQLAPLGYDESSVHLASYDWRLRFDNLERRDAYFSDLKRTVEHMSAIAGGEPAVFVTHSMGYNVLSYFLQWVHSRAATGLQCPELPAKERLERQSRWPQDEVDGALPPACDGWWARRYLRTWINLAGPGAGTSKGLPAWYNGQMTNNAGLGPILGSIVENRLPKRSLRELWRTFHSMTSLQPVGGARLWGGRVGVGGTRAPWSGWQATHLEAPEPDPAGGQAASTIRGEQRPMSAGAGMGDGVRASASQVQSPAVVAPLSASAYEASRALHPSKGQMHFPAPDERLATGPVGRGMFSLRRFLSWERMDPAALAARLLAPMRSYVPAVWGMALADVEGDLDTARDAEMAEVTSDGNAGEAVGVNAVPKGRPGSTSQPLPGLPGLAGDTLAASLGKLLRDAGIQFAGPATAPAVSPTPVKSTKDRPGPVEGQDFSYTSLHRALEQAGIVDEDGDGAITADDAVLRLQRAENRADGGHLGPLFDTHMSLEQVFDLMRLQSPGFAAIIDAFVDLNAWRPPTEAELDAFPEAAGVSSPGARARYRAVAGGLPRRFWANPLATPLPNAPNASIVCFYGVGRQTERHYNMLSARSRSTAQWEDAHDSLAAGNDMLDAASPPVPVEIAASFHMSPVADDGASSNSQLAASSGRDSHMRSSPGRVVSGTTFSDGDGTVPTLSLALPCSRHYRSREGNPGGMSVVTREMPYDEADNIWAALRGIPGTWQGQSAQAGEESHGGISSSPTPANAGSPPGQGGEESAMGVDWLLHVSQSGLVRGTLDFIRASGGQTSEHVDILLNAQVIAATLAEAGGQTSTSEDAVSASTLDLLRRLDDNLDGLTLWDK